MSKSTTEQEAKYLHSKVFTQDRFPHLYPDSEFYTHRWDDTTFAVLKTGGEYTPTDLEFEVRVDEHGIVFSVIVDQGGDAPSDYQPVTVDPFEVVRWLTEYRTQVAGPGQNSDSQPEQLWADADTDPDDLPY